MFMNDLEKRCNIYFGLCADLVAVWALCRKCSRGALCTTANTQTHATDVDQSFCIPCKMSHSDIPDPCILLPHFVSSCIRGNNSVGARGVLSGSGKSWHNKCQPAAAILGKSYYSHPVAYYMYIFTFNTDVSGKAWTSVGVEGTQQLAGLHPM